MHRIDGAQKKIRFLTAEWRYLALLNYEIDPALLTPLVPKGTALDLWNGRCFVSLVGFLFLRTKLLGIPIPFHRNFEEVNLRFYVRREEEDELRRGVVFVREVVKRAAISLVARAVYNEPYVTLPTSHVLDVTASSVRVNYKWGANSAPRELSAEGGPLLQALTPGSIEEFLSHRLWGYTAQRDGSTVQYHVAHPRWQIWPATRAVFSGDVQNLYGAEFEQVLRAPIVSPFIAEGSPIVVFKGEVLPDTRAG